MDPPCVASTGAGSGAKAHVVVSVPVSPANSLSPRGGAGGSTATSPKRSEFLWCEKSVGHWTGGKENKAIGANSPAKSWDGSTRAYACVSVKQMRTSSSTGSISTSFAERPGRLEELASLRRKASTAGTKVGACTGEPTSADHGADQAASLPSLGDRVRAEVAKHVGLAEGLEDIDINAGTELNSTVEWRHGDSMSSSAALVDELRSEQPLMEALRRRFALMSTALQRSNDSQAVLQGLLERTLDQNDKLRDALSESKRDCERLRVSEAEARQRGELQHTSLAECRLERDAIRLSEAECRRRAETLQVSETDARRRIEKLEAAEEDARRQCEKVRLAEAEARRKCEQLHVAEAELRRSRDHHHQRWCALDQEREGLQRTAQQAQAAEKSARTAEKVALEEAASWRRWLASFLDVLLRRGAGGLEVDGDVSKSQCFQEKQPRLHTLLAGISESASRPGLQPELLGRLPALFDHVSDLISGGRLVVRWGGELEEERRRKDAASADSAERIAQLERRLQQKELAVASLEHDRRALQGELRVLQNTVQELKGSIRVFCRLRPTRRGHGSPLAAAGIGCKVEGSQRVALRKPPGDRRHEFLFDRVFAPEALQRGVYEEVEPLLPGVLEGLHLCIFAYGQTGAGKTYTLAGNGSGRPEEQGIQDLAIGDLLRLAEAREKECDGAVTYEMWLSALEIYNESIQDLLVESSGGGTNGVCLDIRQSSAGAGVGEADMSLVNVSTSSLSFGSLPSPFGAMRVPGLQMWRIHGPQDVEPALQLIASNRHVAATALNSRSSRSHCVLSLSLVQRHPNEDMHNGAGGVATAGVLHIVDLAGSERTKVSQAEGQQMKEANAINKSLAALADVLYSLGEESPHVPYRNSKLTYLLQEALGGAGCKTLLFAQISPEPADVHETYSTLTFASRVATNVQKGRLKPPTGSSGGSSNAPRSRQSTPMRTPATPPTGSRSAGPGTGERKPSGSPSAGRRHSPDASPRSQAPSPDALAADMPMSSPVLPNRRHSTGSSAGRSSNGAYGQAPALPLK